MLCRYRRYCYCVVLSLYIVLIILMHLISKCMKKNKQQTIEYEYKYPFV